MYVLNKQNEDKIASNTIKKYYIYIHDIVQKYIQWKNIVIKKKIITLNANCLNQIIKKKFIEMIIKYLLQQSVKKYKPCK